MVQFGPWSSPGLGSVGKILCPSINNSLCFFFFNTVLTPGDNCCVLRGEGLHRVSVVVVISSCIRQCGEKMGVQKGKTCLCVELHWV